MVVLLLAAILAVGVWHIFKCETKSAQEKDYIRAREAEDLDRRADRAADEIRSRAAADRD